MVWVFAILAVLALGAIAVVASGRGTPMEPARDDRPDAVLPADGPIPADALRRVRFSLAFRGYRMSEVDALLDRLAARQENQQENQQETQQQTEVRPHDTDPPRPRGRGDTESH